MMFFFLSVSGPVGNLTVHRVNNNSFSVQWMRPINLNGVLSVYLVNVTSDEDLQGDMLTTIDESITVPNLGIIFRNLLSQLVCS